MLSSMWVKCAWRGGRCDGVQYEFRGQLIAFARVGFHAQTGKVAAVVERGHAVSETHLHALFGGFVNQDFVENPTAHLVNRAGAV